MPMPEGDLGDARMNISDAFVKQRYYVTHHDIWQTGMLLMGSFLLLVIILAVGWKGLEYWILKI